MSVYGQIGGAAAVDTAVDIFYREVLADQTVSRFFETTDMKRQRAKQKAFLSMVFGGPNNYTGKDMRSAHSAMNLSEEHFIAIAGALIYTLYEMSVEQKHIRAVIGICLDFKDDILNR